MSIVLALISFVSALVLTRVSRAWALRLQLMDVPNARSSHSQPVPRGGGIAIVVGSSVLLVGAEITGLIGFGLLMALGVGGLAVAVIGFIDDWRKVRPLVRLTVHLGAAAWAAFWLGGLPAVSLGSATWEPGWVGYLLIVVAVAGAVNLFNFMDGIDGIAASEAVFVCFAGAFFSFMLGTSVGSVMAAMIVGSASLGFLLCNWPPAKIFMGDVGSGYLGFAVAVLAVSCMREQPTAWIVWMVLAGVFLIDTLATLARRVARGERVHEAHRSHAYQWLARRWGHLRVTVSVILINLLWLFPWGLLAVQRPDLTGWILAAALAPLAIVVVAVGAGRPEATPRRTRKRSN